MGRAVQFKWPNDVMVAGRKLSGILLESTISGGRMDALVAGVGLNLNTFFDESISNEINAVSCRMLTGQWIDVHRFSTHFLEIFENVYFEWIKNKLNPVISEWEKYSLHKNRSVSVRLPEETVIGTFAGLTSGGFLRLRQKSGAIRIITAGKVVEY
ncbi:MAG: biotin--[acetyl-CoA-carboxylase] ligase [Calditrichaeota bacterium]|nr:MAG: biotin--[acetyl-CoA-carboxylase] ligase [Calditrichota bacterium]